MLSKSSLYDIIDLVLAEAKPFDARVLVNAGTVGLTRYANSEIHQSVYEDATEVTITITTANKRSETKTTAYDEASLREVVRDLVQNLTFLPEGEEQPALVEGPPLIETEDWSAELEEQYTVEKRAQLIKDCLDTLDADHLAYGALTYSVGHLAFGNSRGIKRFARTNRVNFSALVAASAGGSGFAKITGAHPDKLDVPAAFARARQKALFNKDPIDLEPGAYTVILEPLAVSDLVSYMSLIAFTGKSVQNQSSFLTGKLGERVFDPRLNLTDDYTDENTMRLPFDFEGAARTVVNIISAGVATDLTHDGPSAKKAGVPTTGHSVNMPNYGGLPINLVMTAGEKSLAQIISESDQALLVTRFHYMNPVNPRQGLLTALTRDGFFKIEKGTIVAAVKNMRFTESMLVALNNVVEISSDRAATPSFFANHYVPALKLKDFHFTGKTQA
ncbi:MAG: Metalloprotease PmbA [Firmicutes bacterium]|nr:Metalloprotease PmbA [Bacillota bacterium]MBT9158425.1 Metalloprotease PmbA [Bacillota bacterium]